MGGGSIVVGSWGFSGPLGLGYFSGKPQQANLSMSGCRGAGLWPPLSELRATQSCAFHCRIG